MAYVQLRESAAVSENELLLYAPDNISEKAAIPRVIRIVAALPVTAVGKIFKPALVQREIESVVREEAEHAGVTLAELEVRQDPKLGMVADYRVAQGDEGKLAKKLLCYAFRASQLRTAT